MTSASQPTIHMATILFRSELSVYNTKQEEAMSHLFGTVQPTEVVFTKCTSSISNLFSSNELLIPGTSGPCGKYLQHRPELPKTTL